MAETLTDEIALESSQLLYITGIEAFRWNADDAVDPTGLPVFVAFAKGGKDAKPEKRPQPGDWKEAEWVPGHADKVRYLTSPAELDLARGEWYVWLHIDGEIEDPIAPVKRIKVV